jgi:hypothetical protein
MTTPWRMPQIKVLTSEKNNPYASATATVNIVPDSKVKYVEEDIAVVEPNMPPPVQSRGITTENETNVYKILLDAYIKNPLRYNDYVIMSGGDLCNLIKELTGAKVVELEAEIDIKCCGKASKFNTIKNIICIDETGTRLDFEIEYNKDFRILQDYRISTHLTYDDYGPIE